jgi:excinuclease ABC subunit B
MSFKLISDKVPKGDQPDAIAELVRQIEAGRRHQVLLGVTGSGKTFTMANVIAQTNRCALVLAHNKTLAAQLFSEFQSLFPENAVEYFVSYYDYYQPEAYVPTTDTYIAKDAKINEEIDRLRHSATRSLLEGKSVIIVASVSCIYGLGSSEAYYGQLVSLMVGMEIERDEVLAQLVEIQYERNDYDFHRGTFRVRGDVLEIFPVHEDTFAIRVEFFGDEIESIHEVDPLRGKKVRSLERVSVYPGSHYVVAPKSIKNSIASIRNELGQHLRVLRRNDQLLEAQRLEQRTRYDLEQLEELGFCSGIENYSRYLTGRDAGDPPPCLLDYFPSDWLLFVDESHVSLPQVRGMYRGDQSRKSTLIEHGFRLPSALDNRPLKFDEFEALQNQVVYVSATPGDYEVGLTQGEVVEQIIRPTGLVDPVVELRPATIQVDDLLSEVTKTVSQGQRVLITTLTKRMSEDLTDYYQEMGVRVRYLHSDIDTIERTALLRDLRLGVFDVLVGINLLREGLDLPEVTLVAILDADREGFLRNQTSLIQTIGRAARNVDGRVILYADRVTRSIEAAMSETERRRAIQIAHNEKHGITPKTVSKPISDLGIPVEGSDSTSKAKKADIKTAEVFADDGDIVRAIDALRIQMKAHAKELDFEAAADCRDKILELERTFLGLKP